jgi:hypothetical protein
MMKLPVGFGGTSTPPARTTRRDGKGTWEGRKRTLGVKVIAARFI